MSRSKSQNQFAAADDEQAPNAAAFASSKADKSQKRSPKSRGAKELCDMNNDELMDYVLQNHPRFAKLFSEGENTVICDGVAAARAFELRKNPLSTVCRAGQYMMSVLRTEYRLCIVALDHRGIIKFERMIKLGPRWSSSALSSLLVEMLHPIPNAMVILGVTMKIKWNELMEFNKVYGSLKENGIDMVDLIEVHDGCFSSVIKMLSPKEGAEYEQFVSKKKQRKTESPLP